MKRFNVKFNVGKVKYLISYHDGEKKHKDGSDFFDIKTCNSKKEFNKKKDELLKDGYVEL